MDFDSLLPLLGVLGVLQTSPVPSLPMAGTSVPTSSRGCFSSASKYWPYSSRAASYASFWYALRQVLLELVVLSCTESWEVTVAGSTSSLLEDLPAASGGCACRISFSSSSCPSMLLLHLLPAAARLQAVHPSQCLRHRGVSASSSSSWSAASCCWSQEPRVPSPSCLSCRLCLRRDQCIQESTERRVSHDSGDPRTPSRLVSSLISSSRDSRSSCSSAPAGRDPRR